jgi:hypothetical protein
VSNGDIRPKHIHVGANGLHDVAPVMEDELQVQSVLDLAGVAGTGPCQPGFVQSAHELVVALGDAADEIASFRYRTVLPDSEYGISLELDEREGRVNPLSDPSQESGQQSVGIRDLTIGEGVIRVFLLNVLQEQGVSGDVGKQDGPGVLPGFQVLDDRAST